MMKQMTMQMTMQMMKQAARRFVIDKAFAISV